MAHPKVLVKALVHAVTRVLVKVRALVKVPVTGATTQPLKIPVKSIILRMSQPATQLLQIPVKSTILRMSQSKQKKYKNLNNK